MTTARESQSTVPQNPAAHETNSLEFISHLLAAGLSSSFDSMKDKVSVNIMDNGEQYLSDALEKLKTAATDLAHWGKKNPVKTTIAVAAVLAVTAFLVSTAKKDSAHNQDKDQP